MPGITVVSVDPLNAEVGVYRNRPATVRMQNADSTDYTKVETSQADFAAGTLTDVRARTSDDLVLGYALEASSCISLNGTSSYGTIAANAALEVGTGDFTIELWIRPSAIGTNQRQLWSERTDDSNYLECDIQTNGKLHLEAATGGATRVLINGLTVLQPDTIYHVAFVVSRSSAALCKVYLNGVNDTSGTPTTGTTDLTLNQDVIIGRWTSGTPLYFAGKIDEIRLWKAARTQSEIQATMYYELAGNESNLAGYWKCNEDTGSAVDDGSPNSNTLNLTSCSWSTLIWLTADTYLASGNRISPAYSIATVGKIGGTRIEWDATLPASTSLTIKVSKDGAAWSAACTNGGAMPGFAEGDTAGDVYVKAELATTDISSTPVLSEVRLIFRPVMPELVEIVVNGVSCTVANGGLTYWNTAKYAAGVIVDCYEDVYFATLLPWWGYGLESVDLVVKHDSLEKSATTFDTEQLERFWANGYAKWQASAIGGVYDGPMAGFGHYFVSTIEPWLIRGEFHYNVQGAPRGAFDAYYWVAHAFSMDTPASGIVGQPCPSDTPASGIVQGWTPSDTPASGIVQGWMRHDYPASGIAGVRVVKDEPASGIAGRRVQSDTPGSGVVYQVNANNTIELRVLSVEEAAALAELGISFE
jgi:hypothetical protein